MTQSLFLIFALVALADGGPVESADPGRFTQANSAIVARAPSPSAPRFASADAYESMARSDGRFAKLSAAPGCSCLCAGAAIFTDGFETGNTDAWSTATP